MKKGRRKGRRGMYVTIHNCPDKKMAKTAKDLFTVIVRRIARMTPEEFATVRLRAAEDAKKK